MAFTSPIISKIWLNIQANLVISRSYITRCHMYHRHDDDRVWINIMKDTLEYFHHWKYNVMCHFRIMSYWLDFANPDEDPFCRGSQADNVNLARIRLCYLNGNYQFESNLFCMSRQTMLCCSLQGSDMFSWVFFKEEQLLFSQDLDCECIKRLKNRPLMLFTLPRWHCLSNV